MAIANQLTEEEFERKVTSMVSVHLYSLKFYSLLS